jgi:hypothetical protein
LDGAQGAIRQLGDKVDADIRAGTVWPIRPKPHMTDRQWGEWGDWTVGQPPAHYTFELFPSTVRVGVKGGKQLGEVGQSHEEIVEEGRNRDRSD